MELKCIMRGYNASNNPSNYKDARWSHPGFSASQVDTSTPAIPGNEGANPYRIWTIKINTSTADAGKKWATCEFQQGDFTLSTDFKFLIFRNYEKVTRHWKGHVEHKYGYGDDGGFLDNKDLTQQVEDDIKRQISEHYSMPASSVTRSGDGQTFSITVPNSKVPLNLGGGSLPQQVSTTPKPTPTTDVKSKCCTCWSWRGFWTTCNNWKVACHCHVLFSSNIQLRQPVNSRYRRTLERMSSSLLLSPFEKTKTKIE